MEPTHGLSPMEARLVADLPVGEGWQFEPKWDGFRALVFRRDRDVEILSKSGKPLSRYFPEIVSMIRGVDCAEFTLDGEIILPIAGVLSFDALQARLHPAASRIERLSRETPAQLMLFDCLSLDGRDRMDDPLSERRRCLELFHAQHGGPALLLSERTQDIEVAASWLARAGGALDGVGREAARRAIPAG